MKTTIKSILMICLSVICMNVSAANNTASNSNIEYTNEASSGFLKSELSTDRLLAMSQYGLNDSTRFKVTTGIISAAEASDEGSLASRKVINPIPLETMIILLCLSVLSLLFWFKFR